MQGCWPTALAPSRSPVYKRARQWVSCDGVRRAVNERCTGRLIIEGLLRFDDEEQPVPALPSCLIEPSWEQLSALLPQRHDRHPPGCHRPRIGDRMVFELLVNEIGRASCR